MSNGASESSPPASPAPPSPTSGPLTRLLFVALAALLTIGVVELGSALTLLALEGGWVSPSDFRARRLEILGQGDIEELEAEDGTGTGAGNGTGADDVPTHEVFTWRGRQVIHPFVGYVNDALRMPFYRPERFDATSRELGFPFNRQPLPREPSPERWVIGIFGGSFAEQTHRHAGSTLEAALEANPRFAGRDVVVLGFAAGGYKQPQQLMAASYLLSLGIHLDMVINLDGFNEINLPVTENLQQGVFPFFPRGWKLRVEGLSPRLRQLMGEVAWLGQLRRRCAALAQGGLVSLSPTANLVWRQVDLLFQARIGDRERELVTIEKDSEVVMDGYQELELPIGGPDDDGRGGELRSRNDFQAAGPALPYYPTWKAIYTDLAAVWARSSRALRGMCEGQGIEYYHFLQPNQYVKGSKPWSPEERAMAHYRDHPWRRGIDRGYPLMRAAGEEMRSEGLRFHDLVPIFRDREQTLYADACCHLNREGYALVAREIARRILEDGARPLASSENAP